MSVILYDADKFSRIARTLVADELRGHHHLYYSMKIHPTWEQWQDTDVATQQIHEFCIRLQGANVDCWNENYDDQDVIPEPISWDNSRSYNNIEMYKSLRGVAYNIICNDGHDVGENGLSETLQELVASYASEIITNLPAYELAQTW